MQDSDPAGAAAGSLLALGMGGLVVMRCLNPAPLHHQLGLAVLLVCGKPLQNIVCMQGLGHVVSDVVRFWGWAWVMRRLFLHHQDFLPKSLSTHEALFSAKRCKYSQN